VNLQEKIRGQGGISWGPKKRTQGLTNLGRRQNETEGVGNGGAGQGEVVILSRKKIERRKGPKRTKETAGGRMGEGEGFPKEERGATTNFIGGGDPKVRAKWGNRKEGDVHEILGGPDEGSENPRIGNHPWHRLGGGEK